MEGNMIKLIKCVTPTQSCAAEVGRKSHPYHSKLQIAASVKTLLIVGTKMLVSVLFPGKRVSFLLH